MTAAHPLLPADARVYLYLLSAALTVPAIGAVLRRTPAGRRTPWWLLIVAMSVLSAASGVVAFGDSGWHLIAEMCDTTGHVALLAAAVALVMRRGGNDMGGMLDVSVAAIAVGGLLWTALLSPRLIDLGAATGDQVTMLVSLLVLGGILGALVRLWFVDRRLRSLRMLMLALLTALVGNVAMAWMTGTMISGHGRDVEILFMVSFICVGLAVLDPSAQELMHSGPAPVDRLTTGRLACLALALVASPVAGGMRSMIVGRGADGPLMVVGSVLVTALVMVRVGRLARQRQDAEQLLRHQATHDLLTGLPNRAELLNRLAAELDRERSGPPSVVLLFCDLNGFKLVNDRLGHEVGDLLLTGVAERIRSGLRAGDTLARYGGDEFLLLCSEPAQQEEAVRRLTAHVRQALAAPFGLAGEAVTIGVSVGAVISDGHQGADELISRADQAMYRAKQGHRAAAGAALGLRAP